VPEVSVRAHWWAAPSGTDPPGGVGVVVIVVSVVIYEMFIELVNLKYYFVIFYNVFIVIM